MASKGFWRLQKPSKGFFLFKTIPKVFRCLKKPLEAFKNNAKMPSNMKFGHLSCFHYFLAKKKMKKTNKKTKKKMMMVKKKKTKIKRKWLLTRWWLRRRWSKDNDNNEENTNYKIKMKMIWNYCPFWIILYLIPLQACWRLSSVKESKDVKWTLNHSRHVLRTIQCKILCQ